MVIIVDDPEKGIVEGNLSSIGFKGPERCPHLRGDKPGSYSCAVHNRPWYKDTPCYSHGQIESDPSSPCRMGTYLIETEVDAGDAEDE